MAFTQQVAVARDIAAIIGGVVTLGFAWYGLTTWKRQFRTNIYFELGRRLLRSTYNVREGIREIRNPFACFADSRAALIAAGFSDDHIAVGIAPDAIEYAKFDFRWKKVSDCMLGLHVETLEAEAVWGGAIHEVTFALHECVSELELACRRYLQEKHDAKDLDNLPPENRERIEHASRIAFSNAQGDEFTRKVNTALMQIDAYVKQYMKL